MFLLFSWLSAVALSQCPSECENCYDLNTATSWELQESDYMSLFNAMNVVINYQPNICSKDELLELDGVTQQRIESWRCLYVNCENQVFGEYVVGDWSDCSKSCDNGETSTGKRTRSVTCVDADGNSGENVICNESTMPAQKEICNVGCVFADWQFSDWKSCKAVEGSDVCVQTRQVQCIDSNGLMASACNNAEKPVASQDCDCPDLTSMLSIDMLKDFNMKNSNTDYYVDVPSDTVIVRRGEEFWLWIANSYHQEAMGSPLEEISTSVKLIKDPVLNPEQEDDAEWGSYLRWEDCTTCENAGEGWLIFDFPVNAAVGKYKVMVTIYDHEFTPFNIVVLFNPFNRLTDEYMEDIIEAREYVQEQVGLIWQGSTGDNSARTWDFGANVYDNLEVSLLALRRSVDPVERGSLIYASRSISYTVGQDICYGRWEEPYIEGEINGGYNCDETRDPEDETLSECKEPWYWSSTSQLFAVFKRQNSQVQFCQCWVFAGVTNTVARALGIPSRIVTNFDSAHDTEENRAIEKFYRGPDEGGAYYSEDDTWGTSSDSVWNFHVWNEVYFKRDDIDVSADAQNLLVSEGCVTDNGEWDGMWQYAGEFNGKGSWTRTFRSDEREGAEGEVIEPTTKFIGYSTEYDEWVIDTDTEHDFSAVHAYRPMEGLGGDLMRPPSGTYITTCNGEWQMQTWKFEVPDANGWQAIDATPQEPSVGYGMPFNNEYVLGPASIKQMKENRDTNYDNQFVIGEVNANIHFWTRPGDSEGAEDEDSVWTLESITDDLLQVPSTEGMAWWFSMGSEMSVKKPGIIHPRCIGGYQEECEAHRMLVTHQYKYVEPSDPGSPSDPSKTFEIGQEWPGRGRRLQAVEDDYVEVSFTHQEGKILADRTDETIARYDGDHSTARMSYRLASFEDEPAQVYITFQPRVSPYNGVGSRSLDVTVEKHTLQPGEEITVDFEVPLSMYEDFILNSAMDVHSLEVETFISVKVNGELLGGMERYHRARNLICIPETYLRNSVTCRRDHVWSRPVQEDIAYECVDVADPSSVGDGVCDSENNVYGCFDGGDCCTSTCGDSSNCKEEKDECFDPRAPDFTLFECPFVEQFAASANRIRCSNDFTCGTSNKCSDQIEALDQYGEIEVCFSHAGTLLSDRARSLLQEHAQCKAELENVCETIQQLGAIFDLRTQPEQSLACARSATLEHIHDMVRGHSSVGVYGIHDLQSQRGARSMRGLGAQIVDLGNYASISHCDCDSRSQEPAEPVDDSVFCSYPKFTIPGADSKDVQTEDCKNVYGVHGGQMCTVACSADKTQTEVWQCISDNETSWGGLWEIVGSEASCPDSITLAEVDVEEEVKAPLDESSSMQENSSTSDGTNMRENFFYGVIGAVAVAVFGVGVYMLAQQRGKVVEAGAPMEN